MMQRRVKSAERRTEHRRRPHRTAHSTLCTPHSALRFHPRAGVALISVMAILSILAVVAFSFLAAARLELTMSRSFQQFMRVQDVSEAALRRTNTALYALQNGPDKIPYSGDEPRPFDSKLDPWYVGFVGRLDPDSVYSSRGYIPGRLLPTPAFPDGLSDPEYFLPLGLDEDPIGDLSVQMGYDVVSAPGLYGVDDDGDGLTDEDNRGIPKGQPGYNPFFDNDDDEDGLVDEDPGYLPPDSTFTTGTALLGDPRTNPYFREHHGVDDDGDFAGVVDHSGLLNLNWAGNSQLRYNEGLNTFEIDLVSFFINQGWPPTQAETLARAIITYRLGADGVPGRPGDDNGNDTPDVGFNGRDDDGDGEIDEFDEIYIGAPRVGLFNGMVTVIQGDGLDNDMDGLTDEPGEGTDEPGEFDRVFDNHFGSIDELALVPGFGPTDFTFGSVSNFAKVRSLVTIYGVSPQVSWGRGAVVNDPLKGPYSPAQINPSLLLTFQARAGSLGGISYLCPLQIDNDGDWDHERDDHNRNGRPDGDWDSGPEADTFDPRFSSDGIDNDRDGLTDEPGEGNGIDDDRDGLIDDDGDINGDGNIGYDPEWGVNEDPWGDANADGFPGIQGLDDDGDGGTDFEDPEVRRALNAINTYGWANDGIDNDWDGLTDEPGEPYIAAWDDDEDGRFDEDPPEFQWLANMLDSIDQAVGGFDPPTVSQLHGYSGRHVRDPFEIYAAYLGTTPDQLPIPVTSPGDGGMQPMVEGGVPNDPLRNLNTPGTFRGLEGVRINEVATTPVIHLEAEHADSFEVEEDGKGDDTPTSGAIFWRDTSWRIEEDAAVVRNLFGDNKGAYVRELYSDTTPRRNRAYFRVLNDPYINDDPSLPEGHPSLRKFNDLEDEEAAWTWEGIPNGIYDAVFTLGPANVDPFSATIRDTLQDHIKVNGSTLRQLGGWKNPIAAGESGQILYRTFQVEGIEVRDGELLVEITILKGLGFDRLYPNGAGTSRPFDFSFDCVDLFARDAQYLELINLSRQAVDVSGWQIWVTGQNTHQYVIEANSIIPAFDPANPVSFNNYLVIVPDNRRVSQLEQYYGYPIRVGAREAVAADGRRLAFSELTAQNDLNPREGTIQLVGPVAGTGINLVAVDQMRYFTARLNPLKPTGRVGFIAQERRDPGERRFPSRLLSVNNRNINQVTPEAPTMRFYGLEANREGNLDRMRLLGDRRTDSGDADIAPRLGIFYAESDQFITDINPIRFTWEGSQQLATAWSEHAVYQVRLFGRLNYPVGQVDIPLAAAGTDLNANWLDPKWDISTKDLYADTAYRRTRAPLHHGDVAFYWYPREHGDLELALVCDGLAYDFKGEPMTEGTLPGFFFDYVEVTRVGDYDPSGRQYLVPAGTPGLPNAFYLPDFDPTTGEFWSDPTRPFDGRVTHDFGLDRDGKTQRYVPVKDGGMASPGYIINVHNGKPFGRFGIRDASASLPFLTGWRTEGAMVPGQINLNTAPRAVLSALPWAPPTMSAAERAEWNWIVAGHVVRGRRLVGHDGVFGAQDRTGDGFFDPQPQNAYGEYGSDDGPYDTVADLLPVLFSDDLYRELSQRFPGQVDKGDLSMMFARVCNLATTRSLVFSVFSRGQVLDLSPDREETVLSQKVVESIFLRFAQ